MLFVTEWTFQSGKISDAAKQFLETGAPPLEGTTLIGRWHKADLSGGFSIVETDDPKAAYETAAQWADMLDMTVTPALQDEDIGPILAKYFQP